MYGVLSVFINIRLLLSISSKAVKLGGSFSCGVCSYMNLFHVPNYHPYDITYIISEENRKLTFFKTCFAIFTTREKLIHYFD
ncbi:hypothetical protein QVD17_26035 [Tagetes erecta]|uniref:Secreted protein n=1 Tax=Tagetes erecta TaxID=13708 RepID=A0AAD8K8L0_TARER|nr:hypothetical protein QVD17_26035 [Tagetes erecta]